MEVRKTGGRVNCKSFTEVRLRVSGGGLLPRTPPTADLCAFGGTFSRIKDFSEI